MTTALSKALLAAPLLSLALLAPPAVAQAAPDAEPSADQNLDNAESPFRFELYTWVWVMGLDGTVGARGRTTDVDASFGDILDASDSVFAFSGRMELGYGKFAGYIDGMYADLGVDDVRGPEGLETFDISFEQTILDFGLMYRIVDHKPTGKAAANPRNLTLDLYGGGRYSGLELTVDPSSEPARSADKNWVDPIFGAKLTAPLAEHWHLMVNGDIGGFGAASDFTWSTTAVIGYDFLLFKHPSSVMLGYRAIGWDYTDGSGDSEFTWDIIQHGVILGFSMEF